MADVGNLISLGNLLVSAHNYIRNFDFFPRFWSWLHNNDYLYILSSSKNSHSLYRENTLSFTFSLTETAHTHTHTHTHIHSLSLSLSLSVSLTFWLPAVNPTKMYTFCNLFLSGSAFLVRFSPASNTASEISTNPERDKQSSWEKTRSSKDALLYFYISLPHMKYLVHISFIVYRTLSIFCLFPWYPC